jgi:hypothetical protein
MPFTLAHPAIVLPLACFSKRWFSMTGLVAGSLAPDFEYFLRMEMRSDYSHTINGVFWFDLPLGVLLAFIFHDVIRDGLIENLPLTLKSRFLPLTQVQWNSYFRKNWPVFIGSVLIGAFSHLFWDGWTHPNGIFVETFPALSGTFHGIPMPVFKILQHASTLLGGFLIVFFVLRLPRDMTVRQGMSIGFWLLFCCFDAAIVILRFLLSAKPVALGDFLATLISASLLALVPPCLIHRRRTQ